MAKKGTKRSNGGRTFGCLPMCCGGEDIRVHAAGNVYEKSGEEEENVKTSKPKPKPSKDEDESTLYSLPSIISYAENPYIEDNKTRHDNYCGRFEKTSRRADITHGSPSLSEREKENQTTVIKTQAHGFESKVTNTKTSFKNEDGYSYLELSQKPETRLPLEPKDRHVFKTVINIYEDLNIPSESEIYATDKAKSDNSWESDIDSSDAESKGVQALNNSKRDAKPALIMEPQLGIGQVLKSHTNKTTSDIKWKSDANLPVELVNDGQPLEIDTKVVKTKAPRVDAKDNKAAAVGLFETQASYDGLIQHQPVDILSQFEQEHLDVKDENSEDFSLDETVPMKISIQMGKAKESPAQNSDEESIGLSKMVEPGTTHVELSSDSRPSIDDQIFYSEAEAEEISNDFDANFQVLDGEEVTEMGVDNPAEKEVIDTEAGVAEKSLGIVNLQAEPSLLPFDAAAPQLDEKTLDAKSMVESSDSGSLTDPELYRVVDFNVSPYVSSDSSIEKFSSAKSIFNQEKQLVTVGRDISSMDVEKRTLLPLGFEPQQGSSSLFVKPKSKVPFVSPLPRAEQSLTTHSPNGHVKPVSCLEGTMSISKKLSKAPKELESDRGIGQSDHSSDPFLQDRQPMLTRAKIEPVRVNKTGVLSNKSGIMGESNMKQAHSKKKMETTLGPVKVGLEHPLQRHQHSQINRATSTDVYEQSCNISTEYKQQVDKKMLNSLHQPKQQSAKSSDHEEKSHQFRPDLLKDESNLHPSKIQTKEHQVQVQKSPLAPLRSSDLKGEKSNLHGLQMQTTDLPAHLHRPQLQPASSDHLRSDLSQPTDQSMDKPLHLKREKIQPPRVGIGPKSFSCGHDSVSQQSAGQFSSEHQTHLHRPQLQPLKVQASGSDSKKQQPHLRGEKTETTSCVVASSIEQIRHSSSVLSRELKQHSFERVKNLDGTTLLDHPQDESFPAPKDMNQEKLGTVLYSGSKLKRPAIGPLRVNQHTSLTAKKDISFSPPTIKNMPSSSTFNKKHRTEPLSPSPPLGAQETILKAINFNDMTSSRVLERPNAFAKFDPIQPAKWNSSSSTKTGRRFDSNLPEAIPTPAPDARVVNPQATSKSLLKSDDALSKGAPACNVEPPSKQSGTKGTKCTRDMLMEKNQIPKSPSPPEDGRFRRGKTYRTKKESNRADAGSPYLKEPCPPPSGKKTQPHQKVPTPSRKEKESGQTKEKSTQQQVPLRKDSESSSCEAELHSPRPAWNLTKANSEKSSSPYKESSSDCAAASDVTDNEDVTQIQAEERQHMPRPPPSGPPSDRHHSRPFPPLRQQRVENLSLRTTASTDGKSKKQVSFNLPNLDCKTSVDSSPQNRQN